MKSKTPNLKHLQKALEAEVQQDEAARIARAEKKAEAAKPQKEEPFLSPYLRQLREDLKRSGSKLPGINI